MGVKGDFISLIHLMECHFSPVIKIRRPPHLDFEKNIVWGTELMDYQEYSIGVILSHI